MHSTYEPDDAVRLFRDIGAPWWVAGGWAIDLWIGRTTRPHEDLDVAILRRDLDAFRHRLARWDVRVARDGELEPLAPGGTVDPPLHALWCRPADDERWAFELLLNDATVDEWVFRRDERIRLPLSRIGGVTPTDVPFLAPEIVLLFKGKQLRETDARDLDAVLPTLDRDRVMWLLEAITLVHPGHPWIAHLEQASGP